MPKFKNNPVNTATKSAGITATNPNDATNLICSKDLPLLVFRRRTQAVTILLAKIAIKERANTKSKFNNQASVVRSLNLSKYPDSTATVASEEAPRIIEINMAIVRSKLKPAKKLAVLLNPFKLILVLLP